MSLDVHIPAPDEQHVRDCLTGLFDLENLYDVPNIVEAVVRLIDVCTCAVDPAGCVGCLVAQRLASRIVLTQPAAVTR